MLFNSLLAAAAAAPKANSYSSTAVHGPSLSEEVGLLLLLFSVLAVVVRARPLLELLARNNNRQQAKALRWPTALRSFSGGLAASYVLLLLLPELHLISSELYGPPFLAFDLALLGLLIFKGIQHFCLRQATAEHASKGEWKFVGIKAAEKRSGFRIGLGLFTSYSALILLTFPFQYAHLAGNVSVLLYLITFALHLGFDALEVCDEDQKRFASLAPRLVPPALIGASVLAATGALPNQLSLGAFSLLAGVVVYNVFQVEVRKPEETSFVWFVSGSAAFAILNSLAVRGGLH